MGGTSWSLRLTLLGLGLRLAFVAFEPQARLIGDEHTWTAWALEIAGKDVAFSPLLTRLIFYPPVYPYFLAACQALFGSLAAAKLAQAVLGALLIPALSRIGALALGPRTGIAAAAIAALYPDLVWFSAHFWSETLFLVLLAWAFERLMVASARGERAAALAAGLLFGLATLTRETALYFVPLAALWLALDRSQPGARARGAAFALAAALTVLPWTCRNWLVYDAFVPVSTSGGLNLWQGNARLSRQEVYALYEQSGNRIERYREARRRGLEAIRERQPTWILEKLRDELPRFWEADSLALAHIRREAYGALPGAAQAAAAIVVVAPYLVLMAAFVAGVAAAPFDRQSGLLLGFLVYYVLLHVATHGFARYRLPAMLVVFVFAGFALATWRERGFASLSRGRRALALVLALVLGASLAPSLLETAPQEEAESAQ
jgi:4-amino-4-deoxy-L-arabinose transferase-like glycosyltransferase